MYSGNIRQDQDVRDTKLFLTNISNRRSERYYYPDGAARFSVMQMDSMQAMDVIERLIERIEHLESYQSKKEIQAEVRKVKRSLFTRQKTLESGIKVNYTPWYLRPFAALFSK